MFNYFRGDIIYASVRSLPTSRFRTVQRDLYNMKDVINVIHETGKVRKFRSVGARFIGTKTRKALKDNRFITTKAVCNYSEGRTGNLWRRVV